MFSKRVLAAIFGILLFLFVAFGVGFRDELASEYRLQFPTSAVDAAADRTSNSADISPDQHPPLAASLPQRATSTQPEPVFLELVIPRVNTVAAVDAGAGRLWIAELAGTVALVDLGSGTDVYRLDLSPELSSGSERGLLGLTINGAKNRLFASFSNTDGDTQIDSWSIDPGTQALQQRTTHLVIGQPFENHNGGHLVFGPDGLLWIGTGDGGGRGDSQNFAQDPSLLLGKMLRVQPLTGGGVTAPSSNPDWDEGRPEVWGVGLRNPWRFSFDRETDQLWVADVGQDRFEEVSVVGFDGEYPNFGWRLFEGTERFTDGEPAGDYWAPNMSQLETSSGESGDRRPFGFT